MQTSANADDWPQWLGPTRDGGYRDRENFKTAIYFRCGGLDLYPH